MKAILIKTDTREITEIEIDEREVLDMLQHVYGLLECEMIEAIRIRQTDSLYVDESGLLRAETKAKGFFRFRGYGAALAGRAVIIGENHQGDWIDTSLSADEVKGLITWLP